MRSRPSQMDCGGSAHHTVANHMIFVDDRWIALHQEVIRYARAPRAVVIAFRSRPLAQPTVVIAPA